MQPTRGNLAVDHPLNSSGPRQRWLGYCKILNPDDEAGLRGPGPRSILDDD